MAIKNRSAHHPTKKIQHLVDFVVARTTYADRADIELLDGQPNVVTGGYSWKTNPDLPVSNKARGLVRLTLSRTRRYPVKESIVPEVPAVKLASWEEEVLLVLAHEFRHIDQFYRPKGIRDPYRAEVDAERFAVQVLEEYRIAQMAGAGYYNNGGTPTWRDGRSVRPKRV